MKLVRRFKNLAPEDRPQDPSLMGLVSVLTPQNMAASSTTRCRK